MLIGGFSSLLQAQLCSDAFVAQVLKAPITQADATAVVDCDLNLQAHQVVTKQLLFVGEESSGVTVNCHGATLDGSQRHFSWKDIVEIKSRKIDHLHWQKIENVTLKNCTILGSIRVWGMGKNAEAKDLLASSRQADHAQRVRKNAPRNIVFEHINLVANGRNPLYFSPGVSESMLLNSQISGYSSKVAIYLDAESTENKIINNKISVRTGSYWYGRASEPLIAIDGSSHNLIQGNHFSNLSHGGIYLYRNCGLKGVVRHSTPSYNVIAGNTFYYNRYKGNNPAIHIGAHGGGLFRTMPWFGSCTAEDDVAFGSGLSNLDFATHNRVIDNIIVKRRVDEMIVVGVSEKDRLNNSPYTIENNRTVSRAEVR